MVIITETIPRHLIFGMILFSIVIIGGISVINEFVKEDSSIITNSKYGEFNNSFNQMSNIQSSVDSIEVSISKSSEDLGLFGVLNALIAGSWQTLRALFTSLGFIGTVFTGTTTIFGIPAWIASLITLMVTVIIAFSIWSAIFQKEL